jgi:hypothetical protein
MWLFEREEDAGACGACRDCRRRVGRPMVVNLPQICRSVPCKHDSRIAFPDWCCDECVEEIFNGDVQTIGKEKSSERAPGNVFDVYWRPQESDSDIMLNIL